MVTGEFTQFNGSRRVSIVRTNADGTLDNTFNGGIGFDTPPRKMLLQPDGKLIVIGPFTSYNGTAVPGIVRLLTDGTIDPVLVVQPNPGAQVLGLALLPDGRFMLSGTFSTINGTSRAGVARLLSDGTVDNSFNALIGGTPTIHEVLVQQTARS